LDSGMTIWDMRLIMKKPTGFNTRLSIAYSRVKPYLLSMDKKKASKKWIGVTFTCCQQYGRAYQAKDGKRYESRCPKCLRMMTFLIGPGGSDDRFFELY